MNMKIYLATGNLNKKREMQELFPEHTIVIPKDEGISFDPDETGSTFYENSMIKASALWNIVHCPVFADDSGICVDALKGIPGIYSSRYSGPEFPKGKPDGSKTPQIDQNTMLINQLNDTLSGVTDYKALNPSGQFLNGSRSCHYVCSMVLYLGPDRFYIAQETMEGSLVSDIKDARGDGGFGYDPLFVLPNSTKTAAELSPEQKNEISHRGKAAKIIQNIVKNISEIY